METAPCVVSTALRRFPWPANPAQRYSLASPWLAVVNARGPWGVWQHNRKEPKWLPFCDSLWRKPWFADAPDRVKVFIWQFWRMAAKEDYWGIVWGEPARLCFTWDLDPETLSEGLAALLKAGAVCYLTHAEKAAAESWRPGRRPATSDRSRTDSQGEGEGEQGGTIGGVHGGEDGVQVHRQGQGTETGTGTGTGDRRQPTGKHARALCSGSSGGIGSESTGTGTATATGTATGERAQGQGHPQGQAQTKGHRREREGTKPENLPDFDRGSGNGRSVMRNARSRSAPSGEPQRLGDCLHWANPVAMAFARRMFKAVLGREAPADARSASRADQSVLGAWASQWVKTFSPRLNPGQFEEFCARCERDVAKKRGRTRSPLGPTAMSRIVPGIVRAMAKEVSD